MDRGLRFERCRAAAVLSRLPRRRFALRSGGRQTARTAERLRYSGVLASGAPARRTTLPTWAVSGALGWQAPLRMLMLTTELMSEWGRAARNPAQPVRANSERDVELEPTADKLRTKPFPLGAGHDKFGLGFQVVSSDPEYAEFRSAGQHRVLDSNRLSTSAASR